MKTELEIVAEALGVAEEDLLEWSDGSFTMRSGTHGAATHGLDTEFVLLEEQKKGFEEYLGEFEGLHLYSN